MLQTDKRNTPQTKTPILTFTVDATTTPIPADFTATLKVSLAADTDWVFNGDGIKYGTKKDKNHEISHCLSECKKVLTLVTIYNNDPEAGEEEADFVFTCKEKNQGDHNSPDPAIIIRRKPN
jgi:hypothetical protein